jgi:oxygen-independent coproporphyrinogen-3 oxidase
MADLSLYLHVPFCHRKCGYCSFSSYAGREKEIPAYVDAVAAEIRLTRRAGARVKTVYFGGGTPSLLGAADISKLLDVIHECYEVDADAEITMEANPGTVDEAHLTSLRASGVNRLSLGVQSLSDAELAFLGRCHSVTEARQSIEQARAAGFDNLSLDFIYGLPHRSLDDWEMILDGIVEFGADHLSLYGLTLEDDTPLGAAVARGEMLPPDTDAAASEYELASGKIGAAGYRQYEISNWARPGYESRHNLVYWRRGEYLGLGAAAHSFIDGQRIANTGNLDDYLAALASGKLPQRETETIDEMTALTETVILGLRLKAGVSLDDIGRVFSIDLHSRYAAEIAELSALGLVETSGGRLRLTLRGRLLGNEVFIRFLSSS